jgi:hypothetical protein
LKHPPLTAIVFLLAIALALFSLSESSRANPDPTDDFAEALGLAPGEFLSWSLGDSVAPVRVGDVGVVGVTWTSFFPPARPRNVLENQGDTPWNPRQRGRPPLNSPGAVRMRLANDHPLIDT